jgi:hypothetical protein
VLKTLSNIPCTAHQTEFKARVVSQCTQRKERSPLVYEIFSSCGQNTLLFCTKYSPLVDETFSTCVRNLHLWPKYSLLVDEIFSAHVDEIFKFTSVSW